MPGRRYEVRISGRLSERAREAFVGMDVEAAPAETIIAGTVDDPEDLNRLLALIQSLGLHVIALEQVAPQPRPPPRTCGPDSGPSTPGPPPG
jgi:hypothetical protein